MLPPSKVTVPLFATKDPELPPLLFHSPETVIVELEGTLNIPALADKVMFSKSLEVAG